MEVHSWFSKSPADCLLALNCTQLDIILHFSPKWLVPVFLSVFLSSASWHIEMKYFTRYIVASPVTSSSFSRLQRDISLSNDFCYFLCLPKLMQTALLLITSYWCVFFVFFMFFYIWLSPRKDPRTVLCDSWYVIFKLWLLPRILMQLAWARN